MASHVERREQLQTTIAHLPPGYFALVMATDILATAAHLLALPHLARPLLLIGLGAYATLWGLTLMRLLRYWPQVIADLTDHERGPGFFTLVAATCLMGSTLLVIDDAVGIARYFWFVGIGLWVVVMYTFFTVVIVREHKPTLETGINGAWLIATVATQSIAVLGALLAAHFAAARMLVLFGALCMYLLGCMLYLSIITLIFYRVTFVHLTTAALTPPYWINMGAVAITTLAGSTLILNAGQWVLLHDLLPFLKGFTLFFWVFGSWWIPLLCLLGVWRHLIRRFPLVYDAQYQGMVFPLGMYTVCTIRLSQALELPFLLLLARIFFSVALVAWLWVFIGLLRTLIRYAPPGPLRDQGS